MNNTNILNLIKEFKTKNIIIYGVGKIGKEIFKFFSDFKIPIAFFWDINADNIKEYNSIKILNPDFQKIPIEKRNKYIIIITPHSENVCNMIKEDLLKLSYKNIVSDRSVINSIIYYRCYIHKNISNIKTCFFCPNSISKNRCEIFDNKVKSNSINSENLNTKNNLYIPSIGLLISNKCNLLCKGCNHLREYYSPSDNIDIELKQISKNIDKILYSVDFIYRIVIVGGESFLHKDFYNIINHILNLPKIGIIQIITNGTIIPKDKNIYKIISNERIIVEISGYENKIPKNLQENVKIFIENMKKYNISYRYTIQSQWFDFGDFNNRNYSISDLKQIYSSCICVSNDLFGDKLHKCSRSLFGTHLRKIPNFESDYIDLNIIPKEDLTIKLKNFFEKEYIESCNFCNGTSTKIMESGRQINV